MDNTDTMAMPELPLAPHERVWLRDQAALQALNTLITAHPEATPYWVAKMAHDHAEAFMAERDRRYAQKKDGQP